MSEDVVKEQLQKREDEEARNSDIPEAKKFKVEDHPAELDKQIAEYREWYDKQKENPDFKGVEIKDGDEATTDQLRDIIEDIKLGRNSDGGPSAVPSDYTEPTDPNAPPMTR